MKTNLIVIMILTSFMVQAQTLYIAHRGASYFAPENTLASVKLGYELGADAVEEDIHLSLDNKIMVIHDYTTKRTCGGKNHKIKETNSSDLRKLDAGSFKNEKYKREKIPFLSEVIDLIPPGKKLVIEIKCGSEVIPFLKEVAEASGKMEQLIFIGFGWETILDTKTAFPDNDCYWLSENKADVISKIYEVKKANLTGLNLYYKIIDEELIKLAKEQGLEVLAWTVDNPDEAKRLINLGVKALTTNRPDWLKTEVEKL